MPGEENAGGNREAPVLLCSWFGRKEVGGVEASWNLGSRSCRAVGVVVWLAEYFRLSFLSSFATLGDVRVVCSSAPCKDLSC